MRLDAELPGSDAARWRAREESKCKQMRRCGLSSGASKVSAQKLEGIPGDLASGVLLLVEDCGSQMSRHVLPKCFYEGCFNTSPVCCPGQSLS